MFIANDILLRMRSALTALLFQKSLRVPSHTRKEGDSYHRIHRLLMQCKPTVSIRWNDMI
jgi:hypothetical protein